jgi:TPR repeat protein
LEIHQATGDAERDCDELASSPFDPNRPQAIGTQTELIDWALRGYTTSNLDDQEIAAKQIDLAIAQCTAAIGKRPKVARYRFNLGNSFYAKATTSAGPERKSLLGQAYENYRDAADLSYMAAFNNMAILIEARETGDEVLGPRQSNEKALDALQKGADLGHVIAMHNLGIRHRDGQLGLVANASKAYAWLSKAADAGYVPAMVAAGRLLLEQRGILEQPNPKRALSLIERAARRGSDEAMSWLGYYYQWGSEYTPSDGQTDKKKKNKKAKVAPIVLVAQDPARSLIWYSRAAELGNTYAQEHLASLLTNGQGLPAPQPQAAGRYWRLAAQGGSAYAQVTLANLLKTGAIPLRPSIGAEEIALLYREAAARGNPEAALRMAELHQDGYRVLGKDFITQDAAEAVRYANLAIELQQAAGTSTMDGDPRIAVEAAKLLLKLVVDRPKAADGSDAVPAPRIDELKLEFGDLGKAEFFNVPARRSDDAESFCGWPPYFRFYIWDWEKEEPPSTMQFDWFERFNPDCQITEDARKQIAAQFAKAKKEKKPFAEVLAAYISKQEGDAAAATSEAN